MNSEQLAAYERLRTIPERARFLLDIGVTARTDIHDGEQGPELVTCAFVGDVKLPITGATEESCIAKAEGWLREMTEPALGEMEAASE